MTKVGVNSNDPPLRRREDRNCAPSLPELKRSTNTPHGTQTGLQVRTAPTTQTSGVSTIRQDSFLSFTSTQERGLIDHRLNWPGRQHVPIAWKRQKHSSTTTMLVPSQVCNIRQKRLLFLVLHDQRE